MFEVLAGGEIDRGSFRSADAIRADAENNRGTISSFCDRDQRQQRMHFADERIVLQAEMHTRFPSVHERHAHRRSVDLPVQQPDAYRKFLWVIGHPPDSLAFARSDRSGRNERGILLLRAFCRLSSVSDFWKQ